MQSVTGGTRTQEGATQTKETREWKTMTPPQDFKSKAAEFLTTIPDRLNTHTTIYVFSGQMASSTETRKKCQHRALSMFVDAQDLYT